MQSAGKKVYDVERREAALTAHGITSLWRIQLMTSCLRHLKKHFNEWICEGIVLLSVDMDRCVCMCVCVCVCVGYKASRYARQLKGNQLFTFWGNYTPKLVLLQ